MCNTHVHAVGHLWVHSILHETFTKTNKTSTYINRRWHLWVHNILHETLQKTINTSTYMMHTT